MKDSVIRARVDSKLKARAHPRGVGALAEGQARVSSSAPRLHEVPLTQDEIDRILRLCGTRALLVGGQALGIWAVRLGVRPPRSLGPTVSSDVDFVGTDTTASELCKALGGNWKTKQGTLDWWDSTMPPYAIARSRSRSRTARS